MVASTEPAPDDEVVALVDGLDQPLGVRRVVLPVAVDLDDDVIVPFGSESHCRPDSSTNTEVVGVLHHNGPCSEGS